MTECMMDPHIFRAGGYRLGENLLQKKAYFSAYSTVIESYSNSY